ncbi:MAG TPA: hypothetical protein VKN76_04115 [Kiloniellaceae bacterium]|nr:hypothetical protein [Kiloniellaceae bacterium]
MTYTNENATDKIGKAAVRGKIVRGALVLSTAILLFLPPFGGVRGLSADRGLQAADSTPVALASLELWRQADRIVTAAPGLLSVTTTGEQNQVRTALQAEIARLEAGLQELRLGQGEDVAGQAAAMAQLAGQFAESLEILDRTASARMAIRHLKAEQSQAASVAQRTIAARLRLWASKTESKTMVLRSALRSGGMAESRRLQISGALIEALMLQRRIEQALDFSERAELALAVAACCTSETRLPDIRPMIEAAVADLEGLLPTMAAAGLPSIASSISALRRAGLGPQGIVSLRHAELRIQSAAEAALARNSELAEAFSGRLDSLVAQGEEATSTAN